LSGGTLGEIKLQSGRASVIAAAVQIGDVRANEWTIYETNPKRRIVSTSLGVLESQGSRDEGWQLSEGGSKGLLYPGRRHQPQRKGHHASEGSD
jgi:hypothetical protein